LEQLPVYTPRDEQASVEASTSTTAANTTSYHVSSPSTATTTSTIIASSSSSSSNAAIPQDAPPDYDTAIRSDYTTRTTITH
jgi:hypothetical protein